MKSERPSKILLVYRCHLLAPLIIVISFLFIIHYAFIIHLLFNHNSFVFTFVYDTPLASIIHLRSRCLFKRPPGPLASPGQAVAMVAEQPWLSPTQVGGVRNAAATATALIPCPCQARTACRGHSMPPWPTCQALTRSHTGLLQQWLLDDGNGSPRGRSTRKGV